MNLAKSTCEKPARNNIINARRLNGRRLSPKIGNKAKKSVLITSIQQFIRGPRQCNKVRKWPKYWIRRDKTVLIYRLIIL